MDLFISIENTLTFKGINTSLICRFSVEIDMAVGIEHFHLMTSTTATISVFLNNEIHRHFDLVIAKLSCVLGISICSR